MRRILSLIMMLFTAIALTACGSDNSSQDQLQISALQKQLADVQVQLAITEALSQADSEAIATVITSLTQTQSTLAQLVAQTAPTDSTNIQKRAAELTTASNQVLVLQSLADSLTATSASLVTAYNTAQASIANLTTQFNAATAQVAILTAQLATATTDISSLTAQLAAANAQVTTLSSQITTLNSTVASLQSQLGAANDAIATLNGQVSTLTSSNTSLTSQLSAANSQITTLNGQITALNVQITTLTDSNNNLTTNNASLNTQITTANATIATLQGQVASLQTELDSANASNSDLTNQLATATGTIATLNAQIALLTSQLDAANGAIADRDATIALLNSVVSTLNATIANMVATPLQMSVSALTAVVSTNITVTATFPASQAGKTATFSKTGGSLMSTNILIADNGTATTTFSSDTIGTFNIYAVQGLYAGGVIVSITAAPIPTYNISGTVTMGSIGRSGVIIAMTGTATGAAVTDESGNYSFTGLPNGSYLVTPTLTSFSFTPASRSVIVDGANITENNFSKHHALTYSCITGDLSPLGRWCDNHNGTVRDMATGLLWLQDAAWEGPRLWEYALDTTYTAENNYPVSLTDGSAKGDWRLPSIAELAALLNGTEAVKFSAMYKFINIPGENVLYWSSSSHGDYVWIARMTSDIYFAGSKTGHAWYVWPVRSGQ